MINSQLLIKTKGTSFGPWYGVDVSPSNPLDKGLLHKSVVYDGLVHTVEEIQLLHKSEPIKTLLLSSQGVSRREIWKETLTSVSHGKWVLLSCDNTKTEEDIETSVASSHHVQWSENKYVSFEFLFKVFLVQPFPIKLKLLNTQRRAKLFLNLRSLPTH
jgi:hypothetical protein